MADSDTSRVGRQRKKRTFFSPEVVPTSKKPAKRFVKDVDVGDQSLRLNRLKARLLDAIPDRDEPDADSTTLRRRHITNRDATVFLLDLFERAIADPVVLQSTLGLTTSQGNEEQLVGNGSVKDLQTSSRVHVKIEPACDSSNSTDKPEAEEQSVTIDYQVVATNETKDNVELRRNEEQCVSLSGRPRRKAAELTKKLTPWWKTMEEQSDKNDIEMNDNSKELESGEEMIVNQNIVYDDDNSMEEWEIKRKQKDDDEDFIPDNDRDDSNESSDSSQFSDSSEHEEEDDCIPDEDKYDIEARLELKKKKFAPHYKIDEDGWFTCLLCTGKYRCKQPRSLLNHYQLHEDKKLNCHLCNFVAGNMIGIRNHKISHGPKNFKCEVCHRRFFDNNAREKHFMRYHTPENEKTYVCPHPDCNKRYVLKKDLKNHLGNHTGEKMCHICGNRYTTSVSLRRHIMNVHEKDKNANKIICEICGKQYAASSKHVFRIHMMHHRNEKPYNCHFCGKAFCVQKYVLEHERTHTGEKPYKCEKCDFVAAKKAQVDSHMKTHTGVKPFKCQQCNYASTWNIQLKTHMAAHSSLSAVSCEICDILFINNKSLNIHNKKYHKQIQSSENEASCCHGNNTDVEIL
ncbi:uncharacterized protein LOC100368236 [Saccoglossus kowalevskii]|uniref:Zinc finger and SCAN domain-containing protein 12-like n=1 Tax=Saccoglossus kowalevskii TaxID=10224 RepID=A0ABM0GWV2_SACKO|nr:PREDICTED: zinc finger and SCAN domain-containing protein 12-like [Saccoglossus kowalevskii]